jgi:chromate transporter
VSKPAGVGPTPSHPSFSEATRVWMRIALLSFGGPAGQIAVMHRILVEERRWLSEARFLHALNFCMLLPGPEAQQLATYSGWLLHGTRGGLVAGLLFILPGIVAIMALSWLYAAFGNAGPVVALFVGIKAAVLAIVLEAVIRIARRALTSLTLVVIATLAFMGIFFFSVPFPVIVLTAGLAGLVAGRFGGVSAARARATEPSDASLLGDEMSDPAVAKSRPLRVAVIWLSLWLVPVVLLVVTLGQGNVFADIAVFFSKMAVVTFGGAYAVLAYVAQQAVENYGWLTPGEMLDGLGMAETTPGPLIMVLQFVGFLAAYRDPGVLSPLLAGTLGGLLATWVTFAPCFLWIFLGAPFVEKLRGNRALAGALSAITAAVVGVILNLAVWFAIHTWFGQTRPFTRWGMALEVPVLASADPWAIILALAAMAMVFVLRLGMLPALAISAALGLGLGMAGWL